ncbi:MAG: magnesium transporter [Lachnospiraceae bacterium]|jgi:magnesium transporter
MDSEKEELKEPISAPAGETGKTAGAAHNHQSGADAEPAVNISGNTDAEPKAAETGSRADGPANLAGEEAGEEIPLDDEKKLEEEISADSGEAGAGKPEKQNGGQDEPEEETPEHPDYEKELVRIIRSNLSPKALRDRLEDYHENDIAEALTLLTPEERKKLYRVIDNDKLSDVFEYIEDDRAVYFNELPGRKKVDLISKMDADEAVDLLRSIDKTERSLLIDLIDDESRRDIALVSSFDEDQIGSRMSTNYIHIRLGLTIKQAMRELVAQAAENDNISTLYVLDSDGIFAGAIDLKDLITAREGTPLTDLITTSYPYVYGQERIEDCIEQLKDYSEDSIPVLDENNKLLGVITSQDVVEVVDEEMGEDYAKLAGLATEEDLHEPILQSIKKRLPWLVILLFLGLIVSSVVTLFEEVVAQLTTVVFFQSLILDMAGNVGTQSLAVTIRILTDGNLDAKKTWQFIWKETRVGLMNGLIIGGAAFVVIGFYVWLLLDHTPLFGFAVSGCIGAALVLAMTISGFAGAGVPVLFKKMKLDPAAASGPLITTLNDLTAVISYYSLVYFFLIQVLNLHG